jgi:hypothetical protein
MSEPPVENGMAKAVLSSHRDNGRLGDAALTTHRKNGFG